MIDQFCGNCGIRTEGNTTADNITRCNICGQVIQFSLLSKPIKNYDEAQSIFESTPLTDRQETGRANTGKSKRKRKRKRK